MLYLVHGRYVSASVSSTVSMNPISVGDPGFLSEETTRVLDDYERVNYYKLHLNEILKGKNFVKRFT